MLVKATNIRRNIIALPTPLRSRPEKLENISKKPKRKEQPFKIEGIEMSGRNWVRLLSIMSTIVKEDLFTDVEPAKIMALAIDQHFQSSDSFQRDVERILGEGGDQAEDILEKLRAPPWER